jgi:hypothetical protein
MVWLFLIVRCGALVERPNENSVPILELSRQMPNFVG